ncbi:MAG: thiamine phosphate synthase [Solirubrobacteraceae bacterium]|jgi:thiamine-phosphate pyrophosphorylase
MKPLDKRLYLVGDVATLERVLDAALAGGVDVVQARSPEPTPAQLAPLRDRCRAAGALFIVNDDPVLAAAVDADGVHVGQSDMPVAQARAIVGPNRLVGLSTHSEAEIDAALDVDYIGVGPVFATPTKPESVPVGLELVRYAAAHARVPFFAIGGIDQSNAAAVVSAGARGIAVVRAIGEAADPRAAARALRDVVDA